MPGFETIDKQELKHLKKNFSKWWWSTIQTWFRKN